MAANITDLIDRVSDSTTGRPVVSTLASGGKAIGATSASITDGTNWTTSSGIHFAIYKKTASGYKDPSTQTDWKGVLSGTTITNLTLTGGTDQAYVAGDVVEITPTSRYAKDLYDWGSTHANSDGTLKTSAVQAALNISTTSADWTPLGVVPTVTNNFGQREHRITFAGVDYTSKIQQGSKLQIPRTSTVPTLSGQFVAASSQYASKASPTGITFTSDFTIEAWVYVNSYPTGQNAILSKDASSSSGSGFEFGMGAAGQLTAFFRNASGLSNSICNQAVPLHQWTHVAVTVTVAAGAGGFDFYMDATNAPAFGGGNNAATSLVQSTGPIAIGERTGNASGYFDGQIAQVRLWSSARTPQQLQDNMSISLVGTETGLVGYWPLNGDFTDKTTNANTLVAAGGATATYVGNPWSATEHAVVTSISYSAGNTTALVFTGPNALPNETLGTISYSSARAPFGFPAARTKWSVRTLWTSYTNVAIGALNADTDSNFKLKIPAGDWHVRAEYFVEQSNSVAGGAAFVAYLKAGSSGTKIVPFSTRTYSPTGVNLNFLPLQYYREGTISQANGDIYTAGVYATVGSGNVAYNIGAGSMGAGGGDVIVAECAYI